MEGAEILTVLYKIPEDSKVMGLNITVKVSHTNNT